MMLTVGTCRGHRLTRLDRCTMRLMLSEQCLKGCLKLTGYREIFMNDSFSLMGYFVCCWYFVILNVSVYSLI